MYTYESSEQGDLSFQQGDVVMVTRKEGDWWTGMVSGKTGVFPSNYVKPRDSASEVRFHSETYKDGPDAFWGIICNNLIETLCLFLVFGTSREDGEPGKETRWSFSYTSFTFDPFCTLTCFCEINISSQSQSFLFIKPDTNKKPHLLQILGTELLSHQTFFFILYQKSLRWSLPTMQQEQSSWR